jgi:hypothetical protein
MRPRARRPAGPRGLDASLDETLTLISLDSDQLLTDVREHPASGAPGYRSGVFVRCPVVIAARAAVGVSRVNASS